MEVVPKTILDKIDKNQVAKPIGLYKNLVSFGIFMKESNDESGYPYILSIDGDNVVEDFSEEAIDFLFNNTENI